MCIPICGLHQGSEPDQQSPRVRCLDFCSQRQRPGGSNNHRPSNPGSRVIRTRNIKRSVPETPGPMGWDSDTGSFHAEKRALFFLGFGFVLCWKEQDIGTQQTRVWTPVQPLPARSLQEALQQLSTALLICDKKMTVACDRTC